MKLLRIKEVATAKGITLAELAKKLDMSPVYLSVLVSEKHAASVKTVEKVAKALDVPISSLFTDYLQDHEAIGYCPYCGARVDVRNNQPAPLP